MNIDLPEIIKPCVLLQLISSLPSSVVKSLYYKCRQYLFLNNISIYLYTFKYYEMPNIKNKPFANFSKREFYKIIEIIFFNFLEDFDQNSQTNCYFTLGNLAATLVYYFTCGINNFDISTFSWLRSLTLISMPPA